MQVNLYQDTAQFYDLGNARGDVAVDIPFYKAIIGPQSQVLEVGCGTGRVAIELAIHGCQVTGIDLSAQMLDEFRKKLVARPEVQDKITLYQADMTNFELGSSFDWIIFPFRVFQALITHEMWLACLSAVQRHMSERSQAVMTLFNPRSDILASWGKKGNVNFDVELPDSDKSVRRIENQILHDADAQVIVVEHLYQVYDPGGVVEEHLDRLELGYLFPDQAQELFRSSGFTIAHVYGSYDFEPLRADVKREQIYILRKT